MNIPEFITREYMENVLAKRFQGHSTVSLVDYTIEPGTKKGENFASQILRLKVKYTQDSSSDADEMSFIVKSKPPADSEVAELLAEFDVFARECFVYKEILAKCSELDASCKIGPELIHVDDNAMVFEDLSSLNFKLKDRKQRLCLADTKIVLKKLAKFHALTAFAASNDADLMRFHNMSAITSEADNPYHFFFMVSMMETLETVKGVPELARFVEWMEHYDMVAKARKVFSRSVDEKFDVLNHGDLWMNNVMFKHKDGSDDAVLVDFQECFYGSPGIDLNLFLYSSCDMHVLENNSDSLISLYYDELSATLKQLKFENIPSLAQIRHEFDIKADQAFIALCTNVPLLMIENPEHASAEYFLAETEEAAVVRRQVWSNPRYIEALKTLLPLVDSRNVFHN